jgi:N-acetylmuramoyl-L-alanine amidase
MRDIKYIVVHCSGGNQRATVEGIKAHWRKIGWTRVGYHFIIDPRGVETQLSNIANVTNGVRGHNQNSIHVCYIGGVDKFLKSLDNRTDAQKSKLVERLTALKKQFPKAKIVGHRDLSPDKDKDGVVERHEWVKMCPSFDAKAEYSKIK